MIRNYGGDHLRAYTVGKYMNKRSMPKFGWIKMNKRKSTIEARAR